MLQTMTSKPTNDVPRVMAPLPGVGPLGVGDAIGDPDGPTVRTYSAPTGAAVVGVSVSTGTGTGTGVAVAGVSAVGDEVVTITSSTTGLLVVGDEEDGMVKATGGEVVPTTGGRVILMGEAVGAIDIDIDISGLIVGTLVSVEGGSVGSFVFFGFLVHAAVGLYVGMLMDNSSSFFRLRPSSFTSRLDAAAASSSSMRLISSGV